MRLLIENQLSSTDGSPVFRALLSLALSVLGVSFLGVLTTVYFKSYFGSTAASDIYLGAVQATNNIGAFLGSLIGFWPIRRFGYAKTVLWTSLGMGFSMALMALFQMPSLWVFCRLFQGVGHSIFFVLTESWLLTWAFEKTRGIAMSYYMVVLYAFQVISIKSFSLAHEHLFFALYTGAFLCFLSPWPIFLSKLSCKAAISKEQASVHSSFSLFKNSIAGVVVSLLGGFFQAGSTTSMLTAAIDLHLSPETIGSFTIAGGALLQWPVGYLADKYGNTQTLKILALTLLAISSLLYLLIDRGQTAIGLSCFFLGGVSFSFYTVGLKVTAEILPKASFVPACGLLLAGYYMGAIISPLIGAVALISGPKALFAMYGGIAILAYILLASGKLRFQNRAAV